MEKDPDHYLESYWLEFKVLIKNLIHNFPIIANRGINLDNWVHNLNYLKSKKKYIEIEKTIETYLIITGWTIMKFGNPYYVSLYVTQLKRWQDTPSMYVEEAVKKKNKLDKKYLTSINDEIFLTYLNLHQSLHRSNTLTQDNSFMALYRQLHIPDYSDKDDIISCSKYNVKQLYQLLPNMIENKRFGSLDVVTKLIDIPKFCYETYGVEVPAQMSPKKIIQLLEKSDKYLGRDLD